jgi:beta-mannosidase
VWWRRRDAATPLSAAGQARGIWQRPAPDATACHCVPRPDTLHLRHNAPQAALPPLTAAMAAGHEPPGTLAQVSQPSDECMLRDMGSTMPLDDPRWKASVPHQAGASWDGEDLRDRCLRAGYGVDPASLRRADPLPYLAYSRALAADLAAHAVAHARTLKGLPPATVLASLQDVLPGAGSGLLDARGRPKSAWHAVREACRPLQVLWDHDPVLGLHACLVNDTAAWRALRLSLTWLGPGAVPVARVGLVLRMPPRTVRRLPARALRARAAPLSGPDLGTDADADDDMAIATLHDAASTPRSTPLARDIWPGAGSPLALPPARLRARLHCAHEGKAPVWWLVLTSDRLAWRVHVDDHICLPEQDWFHLAPGETRRIRLKHEAGESAAGGVSPKGEVTALNARAPIRYG